MIHKGEALHVIRHEDKWSVREENAVEDIVQTRTQQEAIDAREIARTRNTDIVVHAADGTLRARLSASGNRIIEDYYLLKDRIVVSKDVAHGKPRVVGTRILVETILDLLAVGKSIEEITSDDYYPELLREDVLACLSYAGQIVQNEKYEPNDRDEISVTRIAPDSLTS